MMELFIYLYKKGKILDPMTNHTTFTRLVDEDCFTQTEVSL